MDARDNYRVVLDFIEQLRASGTLEACYMAQFGSQQVSIPALFIDQMAHVVLRNILEGCDDPMRVRAAERLGARQWIVGPVHILSLPAPLRTSQGKVSMARGPDQPPDPFRRRGAVEAVDIQGGQRIADGVGDGQNAGDRAGFAAPFHI